MSNHTPGQEPSDGYLDDDFAKFRAQRLAGKNKSESDEPADAQPPAEGFMDDDFARFRAERLKNTPPKASARLKPKEHEPKKEDEDGMFFGTNSNERRRNHAEAEEQRRDVADVPHPPEAGRRAALTRSGAW